MRGMRSAIFIDGGYFDWIIRDELSFARVDYQKFSQGLAAGNEILRTYYYHCEPYQSNPPSPEELSKLSKMQSFLHYLAQLPRYEVRLGKLAFQGRNAEDGKPIVAQKRVDILLGVDLVLLAAKQMITHAVIVAGDSDFLPAIEIARNEGVLVHLYHGVQNAPHRDLWEKCDERTPVTADFIKSCSNPFNG